MRVGLEPGMRSFGTAGAKRKGTGPGPSPFLRPSRALCPPGGPQARKRDGDGVSPVPISVSPPRDQNPTRRPTDP